MAAHGGLRGQEAGGRAGGRRDEGVERLVERQRRARLPRIVAENQEIQVAVDHPLAGRRLGLDLRERPSVRRRTFAANVDGEPGGQPGGVRQEMLERDAVEAGPLPFRQVASGSRLERQCSPAQAASAPVQSGFVRLARSYSRLRESAGSRPGSTHASPAAASARTSIAGRRRARRRPETSRRRSPRCEEAVRAASRSDLLELRPARRDARGVAAGRRGRHRPSQARCAPARGPRSRHRSEPPSGHPESSDGSRAGPQEPRRRIPTAASVALCASSAIRASPMRARTHANSAGSTPSLAATSDGGRRPEAFRTRMKVSICGVREEPVRGR